jgi:hypothetical protein
VDDRRRFSWRDSRAIYLDRIHDFQEGQGEMTSVERVRAELAEYEHPFFEFDAREKGDGVEMVIRSKIPNVLSPEYRITLLERDVQSSQFRWNLQRLIYGSLTDYVVELFTKNP